MYLNIFWVISSSIPGIEFPLVFILLDIWIFLQYFSLHFAYTLALPYHGRAAEIVGFIMFYALILMCTTRTFVNGHPLQPPLDTVSVSGQFTVQHVAEHLQPSIKERRRRLNTYSWGAEKSYSYSHASSTHTLGGKKVLIMRYKQSSSSCSNCDTVISDEDLNYIVDAGKKFISENSYGKATLSQVDVVPGILSIDTNGNFFKDIDACREAAYALGYDFTNYEFDLAWGAADGGPTGGSATVGGRSQRFNYDGAGDRDTFATKIFPHEFTHNFGVGHAWQRFVPQYLLFILEMEVV